MKLIHRLLIGVALLSSGSIALAQDHDHGHDRGGDHGQDRGHDDHHGNDRGHDDHHDNNRGHDDHRGYDRGHDDHRFHGDDHRGYGYRPGPRYYGHPGYYGRPGPYRGHWERGHRYYGPTYVVGNWDYYHLRRPPYGYRWVRADDGFLLVAASTGIILDMVAH